MHSSDIAMSLVLGPPPQGDGRNYRVDRNTLRAIHNAGFLHTRSASLSGLATVWDYNGKSLRGRFRINVLRQNYFVLTGWRPEVQLLLVGEFTSVADRAQGEAILRHTSEGPMARTPPSKDTATAPAAN